MTGIYDSWIRPCLAHPIVYYSLQAVRWIPVLFIVAIVCWGYYAYVFELCFFTVTNAIERVIFLLGFHILLILFMWSYYQTIFSPIGRPSNKFFLPLDLKHDIGHTATPTEIRQILDRFVRQNDLPVTMRAYDGSIRFCEKCQCVKPDRCHHCSVCGQCVLKFDHHCPWVNTCVNYRNYKFFIQFLGYALAFCLWGFFTDMPYFIAFWQGDVMSKQPGRFHILFMFFVTGMFAISVSCLFFYHLYLTAKNQSTIGNVLLGRGGKINLFDFLESFRAPVFTYGPDKNGYNLGIRRNYREVFGSNRLLWFLPIFSANGDGIAFPVPTYEAEADSLLSERRPQIEYSDSENDDVEMLPNRNAAARLL